MNERILREEELSGVSGGVGAVRGLRETWVRNPVSGTFPGRRKPEN